MPFDVDTVDPDAIGGIAAPESATPAGQPLETLPRGKAARVLGVDDLGAVDPIAERLRELGFVAGEPVKVVASGPLGGEPLLVQIGFTRFALRKAEAARVRVLPE